MTVHEDLPYPPLFRTIPIVSAIWWLNILVGMTFPKRPPQRKPRGRHPDNALTPAFVRNVSRAGRYCDGERPLSRCPAHGEPGLDPAPHDPGPPNRARARRIPPGLAEGSPGEGVREPEAGPRGFRSPGREAAGGVDAHLRGGGRAGLEPAPAGLALPRACAAMAGQLGEICLPSNRRDAGLGGDECRRDRDSGPDLARFVSASSTRRMRCEGKRHDR